MAGEAKTDNFMLGTATLMVGPMAKLMDLGINESVGLVKNITLKSTPGFIDLTQGVQNTLVYSVMNSNEVMITGEMYEYTAKNLTYAVGLDGSSLVAAPVASLVAAAIAAPVPPALTAATLTLAEDEGAKYVAGKYITVQVGVEDQLFARKIVSIADDVLTLDSGFPVGIPLNAEVKAMNVVAIGSQAVQAHLAAKIVGKLANGKEIIILIPKVRFSSGISVAFKTDNYDFVPLEMKVFDLVNTDPFYTPFQSVGPEGKPAKAMLLTGQ